MKINPLIILGLALLSVSCNSYDARKGNTMPAAKTDTIPFTMVDTFPSGVVLAPDFNRIIVEVGVNDTVLRMLLDCGFPHTAGYDFTSIRFAAENESAQRSVPPHHG